MSADSTRERDTAELLDDLAGVAREVAAETQNADREELALFFTHSLDLQCVAGLDGYFKRLNPAWMVRLGWTLEELEARPLIDFVHPDDREATLAEIDRLASGERTILFENRYRHQDGSYRWLQWNAWPVPGRSRIYATARDISRQKRLEREILEILDREKERLGRELHDGLCQSLAGIAALSFTLSRRLAAGSESAASGAAAEITELLRESIGEARNLARGLGPLGLRENGLEAALQTLAGNVRNQFRVSCTFECERPFPRLDHEVESHLFRISQEAVHNAGIHGGGEWVEINLSSHDGEGLLRIRDDGVGMPQRIAAADGIGLHTMAYRARLIGGRFEVRGARPNGTVVSCSFPVPERSDAGENVGHDFDEQEDDPHR